MNIALYGATGTIGQAILDEALGRKMTVTAIVRNRFKFNEKREGLTIVEGDILKPESVAEAVKGHDVVISAYGPEFGKEEELVEAARSLVEGIRNSGVQRLLVVGGAGSLLTDSGVPLMETPEFPEEVRPLALAHRDAFHIYEESDLDWTYLSPAATIEPGRRTGNFRIGTDRLILDEAGQSRISVEDYAAAMVDEADDPYFSGSRFTVAY
ncbi:3-beta hydroxysteroid dehydrogenase [Paenibacillus sp. FSL H7-0326]|uniref:NAD(P)-dependent oxidoreductase n=1 Tax=Paenibacillus sp. FSL H7-0326 TaxID=1921144 RepID=UPI00096DF5B4|nr:NAD(P)-dependent oxidoreductase [Paenibacillus sp. FSL H7-0326]OMC65509.1 3-beta hydroxysteroid dehydrogenase [Paenibacillus sp. FSL H7-0326]